MSQAWLIRRDGEVEGPLSSNELKRRARDGSLRSTDELRREDRADWVPACDVRGLFRERLPQPSEPSLSSGDFGETEADWAASVVDMYRGSFESRFFGEPAVLRDEALTTKKREGIATYARLSRGESILFAVDSTFFGVATEGFSASDRALAWFFPDGNCGRVDYSTIVPHTIHLECCPGSPQRLCFTEARGRKHKVACKSLQQFSAAALVDFLAAAARISQGLRPSDAFPRARNLVKAGDSAAAIKLWEALLDDDVLQFPDILLEVTKSQVTSSNDRNLVAFRDALLARANDRESGWLIPRVGDQPEELTSADLVDRWRAGTLRRESRLRHLSDDNWTTAGDISPIKPQRTVYVSDTGPFDEVVFLACVAALASEGLGFDELLVFGPTDAKVEDAPGKPTLHFGLTSRELVFAWVPQGCSAIVERSPAISIVWKMSEINGQRHLDLATAKRSVTFALPPGAGTTHLLRVSSDLFLLAAEQSLAEERRTEAFRLLERVSSAGASSDHVGQLRDRVRADDEVLCAYEGGHPEYVDPCLGTLRLDGDGFEFMSIAPESQVFFRVPYERVVDFPLPQRGALPADIRKSLLGSNSLLSTGLGLAAACVVPGGNFLLKSLTDGIGGDRTSGPPLNRLTALTSLSGTAYKIYFDVMGESVTEMSQKAKAFWSRTAKMKSRFFKPGAASIPRLVSDAGDPEIRGLLREIRDSLQVVLQVLALDVSTERRHAAAVLGKSQVEALQQSVGQNLTRSLGLPAKVEHVSQKPTAVVIACPKCGIRVRAQRPGVIKCPACQGLARLGGDLFAVKSDAPEIVPTQSGK